MTDILFDRSLSPPLSPHANRPRGHYSTEIGQAGKLLTIDLNQHHGDADKLFVLASQMQQEIKRLIAEPNLTQSKSKSSSRRDTDDSDYSLKRGLEDSMIGIAITYDPSDHSLAVRSQGAMKDLNYTIATLPRFHWWTDTLHIYFSRNIDTKSHGPTVIIREKKLPASSELNFIRTIKLGQLGCKVIRRRLAGKLDVIYVLSPEYQPGRSVEMKTVAEPATIL